MSVEKFSFTNDVDWLEARKGYVTATEVSKLVRGSQKTWADLRAQKAGDKKAPDLSGLKSIQHGKARETEIAEWLKEKARPESLTHNTDFFVRDGKYGATPDMVSLDLVAVGEIKTISETRLAGLKQWPTPEYYDQIQWQLFVTGAEFAYFGWEPYLTDGDGLTPWVLDRGFKVLTRDEQRISQLKVVADAFLAGRDSVDVPDEVHVLFAELRDILKQEAELKPLLDRKKEIEEELRTIAGGESAVWDTGELRVSVSAPGVTKRFDKKKLFADNPSLNELDYVSESSSKAKVRVTFDA